MRRAPSRVLAALAVLAALVALAFPAFAFTPPPIHGHVVDTAGTLTDAQILALDGKLDDLQRRTGFEIVAFVAGSLEGEPIEDVAYTTFKAWRIGKKGQDNGVLLLIAPNEHTRRIETGKGVEGALTDLQTNDILREQVAPAVKEGRIYDAVDQGTTAIARALAGDAGAERRQPRARAPQGRVREPLSLGQVAMIAGGLLLVILLSIVSPGFRSFLWFFVGMFLGGGRGGGGGWGGGGGGSGYSGGGGESGGGGSSDSD